MVFEDDFSVYIYWEAALFKILKSEYVLAEIINSKIVYVDTKPTVDYKSLEIKQYKIYRNSNNNGVYISKSFGRLLFLTDGETWSIDVPPFAFEPIKMLFEKQST